MLHYFGFDNNLIYFISSLHFFHPTLRCTIDTIPNIIVIEEITQIKLRYLKFVRCKLTLSRFHGCSEIILST